MEKEVEKEVKKEEDQGGGGEERLRRRRRKLRRRKRADGRGGGSGREGGGEDSDNNNQVQKTHTHTRKHACMLTRTHNVNTVPSLASNGEPKCELSPRSESIKNRCYAHYRLMQVTPTCWQELPSPNGFNTNSSRPKAAPKQRYS